MMDLDKHNLVYQSNSLVNANYDMTALEQKLLLINISTISKKDTNFYLNIFRVKELAELLDCTPEFLYKELPKLSKKIIGRVVEVYNEEKGELEQFNIIHYAKYKTKQGIIELEINPRATKYLLQLQTLFSSFELHNALNLSSRYSIRIYQLTKASSYKGTEYISLDDFKNMLKLTQKSYNRYNNISGKILNPSIKEINDNTDIELDYETVLAGRKAIGIRFKIKTKYKQKVVHKTKHQPKSKFFNFESHDYDYNELERQLLGWND